MFALISCGTTPPDGENPGENPSPETPAGPTIRIPEYGGWDRGTVAFTELAYSRPLVDVILEDFGSATTAIKENTESFESQVQMIEALEDGYENYFAMYSLTEIYTSKDSSNAFWQTEHEYLATRYSEFSKAVEDLYVAAAQSEHRTRFEDEYFGASLEKYVDGGIYTEELVDLLAQEAQLEAQNRAISTANVEIEYRIGKKTFTGTIDNVLEEIKEEYGEKSSAYANAQTACVQIFETKKVKIQSELFVELVKVRSLIADEMGVDSYIEIGYENNGHDYSPEEMLDFLDDIKEIYVLYLKLWYSKFESDVNTELSKDQSYIDTVNRLGSLYKEKDAELYDIYSYMLYYGLFDIAPKSENRFIGSFATYIDTNESPFLFMTADNKQYDYLTLAHEFGHFADMYINGGSGSSIDLSEVSSQGLEYLTMAMLGDVMESDRHSVLVNKAMDDAINTIMFQGFYAMFEHLVYELEYSEITRERLDECVAEACRKVFGASFSGFDTLDITMIVHIIEYPFYVQSYCTSLVSALDIYYMEIKEEGAGFAAYKAMLSKIGEGLSFVETLTEAGIKSPLSKGALLGLADDIHYYYFGKPFTESDSGNNAA